MQKNISKTTQKVVVILIMSVIFGVVLFSPVWALETGKASPIDNAPNLTIKLADWLTDKTNEITTLFKESLESINEFIEEKVNKLEISINNRVEKASKHNLLTAGTSSQEVDSKGPIHQASLVKESGSSMEASLPRGPASGQVLGESIEQGNIFSRIWNKVTDTVSKVINPSSIPPQDKAKVLPSKTAEETQEVKTGTAGEKEAISPYTEVSEDKPVSAQTTATSPSSAGRPATITQIIEKTTTSQAPAIDINAIALKAIELIADQNIYVKTSQYLDNFSEKEKTKKSDNLGANTLTITGQTDLQGPIINSLGDLNVNDNLTSTGLITAPNLNITGSATISGTLTAGSFSPANITTASLNVTRGATIQGSLSVSSFISTGHLSTDSIGISGIMSAKGVSAGESGLSTSGDTYLSGDGIYISGLVDLDNYLDLDISSAQALTIGDGTTNTLVVDTASGAVTITGSLAITGNQAFTGYQTVTASSTTPALTITQTGTGDLLNLFDNTTEVFTVLDGGNVGIGTSSPMYKLAVQDGRVYIKNSIADANNDVYGIDVYASSSAANDYVYSSYFIAQGGYESNGVTGWAYDADYNYGVTAYADGSATENYGIYSSTDTGSGGTVTSAYGIYTEAVSDSLLRFNRQNWLVISFLIFKIVIPADKILSTFLA
ncbi:MAG: hypothetical protein ABIE43_05100 [Patescibacteria group bacterium]